MARERSHGPPARHPRQAGARQPDRRRAQRAPPELRQRAVRQGAVRAVRGALSRGPPVPLPDDRQARGPRGRVGRRREGLLQDLVRAGERDARDRRRLRRRRRRRSSSRSGSATFPTSEQADGRARSPAPVDAGAARSRSTTASRSCARSRSRGTRRRTYADGDAELDIVADALVARGHGPALQGARLRQAARAVGAREPGRQRSSRARSRSRSRCAAAPTSTRSKQIVARRGREGRAGERSPTRRSRAWSPAQESGAIYRLEDLNSRANVLQDYNHYLGDPDKHHVGSRSLSQDDRRQDPRGRREVPRARPRGHRDHEPGRRAQEVRK